MAWDLVATAAPQRAAESSPLSPVRPGSPGDGDGGSDGLRIRVQ